MARMTKTKAKKKQALDAQEKADEEIRDMGIACVREYLRHAEMDFWEKNIDGSLFFTGVYSTEESALSMFRWVVGVDSDVVGIVCCISLRVPKPRLDAVVAFVNKVNAEHTCAGSLAVDTDCGEITFRYDMPTAALKGDPKSALDDFFTQAFGGAIGYSDPILEVVMDATLPPEECKDESAEEAKGAEKDVSKRDGTKREPMGPMTPTALTPDYSLDGLDIQSEVPLDQIVAASEHTPERTERMRQERVREIPRQARGNGGRRRDGEQHTAFPRRRDRAADSRRVQGGRREESNPFPRRSGQSSLRP